MRKIVITGGAGFIGSHIVDHFIAAGDEVHVIDDLSSGSLENLKDSSATVHEVDIRTAEAASLLKELEPDVLVHTAAQISVRLSMEDPVFDTDVNVLGLVKMLHALKAEKFPHVVFISTGGAIYGEQDCYPAPEDHPIAPTSVYGLAKRVSEMYLDLWQREMGLKFCALRLGNVYGPRQNPHGEAGVVAIFNKVLINGKLPIVYGSGEQTRDFVYVKDVVSAVAAAVDKKINGIYNIGTGIESSVNDLLRIISKSHGVADKADYQPAKVGEQLRSCISPELASKTFGWKAEVSLEEGLEETCQWFIANS